MAQTSSHDSSGFLTQKNRQIVAGYIRQAAECVAGTRLFNEMANIIFPKKPPKPTSGVTVF